MIEELAWDTAFFGRKIGRLAAIPDTMGLARLLDDAALAGYAYLCCRIPTADIEAVQRLEAARFYTTDISLLWQRVIDPAAPGSAGVLRASADDRGHIVRLAQGLFPEARFYHDPFFSRADADRFYEAWAGNLFAGMADAVYFLPERGFVGCLLKEGEGDIPLIGVSAGYRRQGVGSALLQAALRWFAESGIAIVTVRTQSGNAAANRMYERSGFSVRSVDISMGRILAQTAV